MSASTAFGFMTPNRTAHANNNDFMVRMCHEQYLRTVFDAKHSATPFLLLIRDARLFVIVYWAAKVCYCHVNYWRLKQRSLVRLFVCLSLQLYDSFFRKHMSLSSSLALSEIRSESIFSNANDLNDHQLCMKNLWKDEFLSKLSLMLKQTKITSAYDVRVVH